MSREDGRWVADETLGPRMRKSVEKVLGHLKSEGASFYTARTGFKGDPVDPTDLRFYTTRIFIGSRRPDEELDPGVEAHLTACTEAETSIKERYDYTLTAKNYKAVIEEYGFWTAVLGEQRPVVDKRRTPDEDRELKTIMAKRDAEVKADRDAKDTIRDEVLALAPEGSKVVIIASLKEDTSDMMTDYSANKTLRSVVIGFSHKTREDFRELHRAAASFPETAHLGSQEALTAWAEERNANSNRSWGTYVAEHAGEHRDNFSMGSGNYLSDHGYDGSGSGWRVSRRSLDSGYWDATEIAPGLKVAA